MSARRFQRGGQPTVSFFAFQDIITAVSGILVVITLLLALHVDRISPVSSDEAPVATPRAEELEARLTELAQARAAIEQLQAARASADPAALEADIARLQQQLAAANARRIEQQGRASMVQSNRAGEGAFVEAQAARGRVHALEQRVAGLERRSAESAAAMVQLEHQVKARQEALLAEEQRRNDLWLIPQRSTTSKEPLLVTVQARSVSLRRFGDAEARTVHRTGEFTDLLKSYSELDHYLVFYFKPSAAGRFEELGNAARDAGFEIGYDVIGEDANLRFTARPATPP